MKSIKILMLLTLPFIIGVIIQSCSKRQNFQYIFEGVRTYFTDADSLWKYVADTQKVNYNDVNLRIDIGSTHVFLTQHENPFISSAYAGDKVIFTQLEKATNIRVISLNNYNNDFPAGSDMSDKLTYTTDSIHFVNKDQVLQYLNNGVLSAEAGYIRSFRIYARFQDIPFANSTQQFSIELITDKNSALKNNSPKINFN